MFSSVQLLSHVWLFATLWTAACQASLSIPNSRSPFKLMTIKPMMPINYVILFCLFFSCPQSFPAPGSFQMSQFFTSGGQSIGVSASASVLPMTVQDWFPLGWTGWISLLSKGLSRVFTNITVQKHHFFCTHLSLSNPHMTFSHPHMTTWKNIAWTRQTFGGKVMSLLFNMLSRLVITFFFQRTSALISWLQSSSAVILEPPQNEVFHYFHCLLIYLPWSDGTGCHDLSFLNVEL